MILSDDMRELVGLFEQHAVTYALVGGYAVNYYGYVRMTQDIDFLLAPSAANAELIMICLEAFGFGDAGIPRSAFEQPGTAIHLGVEPNRIDLLTSLQGAGNDEIFTRMERVSIDGLELNIISLDDLLVVKRSSDRLRDRADAEELARLQTD
jgi:predicted nucleotidyltransferase